MRAFFAGYGEWAGLAAVHMQGCSSEQRISAAPEREPYSSLLPSPSPGRNSLVNGGRAVSFGSVVEEPVGEHPVAEGRPRGGVLVAVGVAAGGQRRGERLFDRGELQLRFERGVGFDEQRRRGGGVGPHRALAAGQRLQERAQVLAVGARLFFADDQHELVVGGHAGLVDRDRDGVLVHQLELDRLVVPVAAERR